MTTTSIAAGDQQYDPALAAQTIAAEHQAAREAIIAATVAAILKVWNALDPRDWLGGWFRGGAGDAVYALLSAAEEAEAAEAARYVTDVFTVLGHPIVTPAVNPSAFAGIGSDGRDIEAILALAPIRAAATARRGGGPDQQRKIGADFLTTVVRTQVADMGRAADQVAIASAEPEAPPRRGRSQQVQYGWVRMLNPPSCSRCVVLAGKFYRWNAGFQRHLNCDCVHIPAVEAIADDLTTSPRAYFDSLSERDQDAYFGKANAEAIRSGADISQVVNATSSGGVFTADDGRHYTRVGTTRRGQHGRKKENRGVLRPTPWQLLRDAHGNRDEAQRLLRRYGYILR